jgi:DNA-binding transcriptional MerR regulator
MPVLAPGPGLLGYTTLMPYYKESVIEQSGLPDRTIRNYIRRGLLPPPDGYGMAATYSEEHMVRAIAIGRMRAQGDHVDTITERIAEWSLEQFQQFNAETDPARAPPPAPAPPPPSVSTPGLPHLGEIEGEPVGPGQPRSSRHESIDDLALPEGPTFRILPLLPGLGLMLDSQAPPIVHRIAAEICHRYGRR